MKAVAVAIGFCLISMSANAQLFNGGVRVGMDGGMKLGTENRTDKSRGAAIFALTGQAAIFGGSLFHEKPYGITEYLEGTVAVGNYVFDMIWRPISQERYLQLRYGLRAWLLYPPDQSDRFWGLSVEFGYRTMTPPFIGPRVHGWELAMSANIWELGPYFHVMPNGKAFEIGLSGPLGEVGTMALGYEVASDRYGPYRTTADYFVVRGRVRMQQN